MQATPERSVSAASPVPVAIVGAGPVGLALALGLARHRVRTVVFERHPTISRHSKAAGIHVRTREVLRQWGVEPPFLEAGSLRSAITLHTAPEGHRRLTMDLSELADEAARPGLLILEQSETERLLLDEVTRSGWCEVRFGAEVVDLSVVAGEPRLTVRTEEGDEQRSARFVVGCDGASSFVRKAIGMPFEGITYALRPMLADVRVQDARDGLPWPRQYNGPHGLIAALRLHPGLWRIIRLEASSPGTEQVTAAEVHEAVARVLGSGPVEVTWAERFRIHRRSSPRFRAGPVLLAGDAAHVHSPIGGLGMNAGIQDAHNLAWKLAAALRGGATDRLLDSYDVERRAVVVERVSRTTDRATRIFLQAPARLRETALMVTSLALRVGPIRRRGLRALSMLDLSYPGSPLLDPSQPAAGIRLPDPLLLAPDGREVRLHRLLPPAAPLLIEVTSTTERRHVDVPVDEVVHVGPGGHHDPRGTLQSLLRDRKGWILVRPDGHVAWARGELDATSVTHAIGSRAP